jgi:uncharacterized membrane protein HdeD (DUF308 family)
MEPTPSKKISGIVLIISAALFLISALATTLATSTAAGLAMIFTGIIALISGFFRLIYWLVENYGKNRTS